MKKTIAKWMLISIGVVLCGFAGGVAFGLTGLLAVTGIWCLIIGGCMGEDNMRNGIEKRKNGAVIKSVVRSVPYKKGYMAYQVTLPNGKPSVNGPWDYLYNARKDADGKFLQNKNIFYKEH